MEMTFRDIQKAEAIYRLKLMGVRKDVVERFERNNIIMLCNTPDGKYRALNEYEIDTIRHFEEAYTAVVYMVVREFSSFGTLFSMLFVDRYESDWVEERIDIKDGYVMTYTINEECSELSEMGSIAYRRTKNGGIIRCG